MITRVACRAKEAGRRDEGKVVGGLVVALEVLGGWRLQCYW